MVENFGHKYNIILTRQTACVLACFHVLCSLVKNLALLELLVQKTQTNKNNNQILTDHIGCVLSQKEIFVFGCHSHGSQSVAF